MRQVVMSGRIDGDEPDPIASDRRELLSHVEGHNLIAPPVEENDLGRAFRGGPLDQTSETLIVAQMRADE